METVIYTVIGIALGGLITYLVSKYYYRKTVKEKSLTPFLQFISGVLDDVDPEVRKMLKVRYARREVTDLYQVQFVIANTGDLAIRDCIEPLTILIPEHGEVLDASILHVEPAGRQVSYQINKDQSGSSRVSFVFPLLNSAEFFMAKLLIRGRVPTAPSQSKEIPEGQDGLTPTQSSWDVAAQFVFHITADDLPPTIPSRRLPYQYEVVQEEKRLDWTSINLALAMIFLGICLAYSLYPFRYVNPSFYPFNYELFFSSFSFLSVTVLVSWLLCGFLIILALFGVFSEFGEIRFKPKPKFRIPTELARDSRPLWRFHGF